MNKTARIQVTDTGKALISRVEEETSASEVTVSPAGITGWVQKRNLPENEFGFAGEVDFGSFGLSCQRRMVPLNLRLCRLCSAT